MGTVLVFAFERAIVNLVAILLGFGLAAWLAGGRLKSWSLGPTARSLVYALFGMIGGLLAYYNSGFARAWWPAHYAHRRWRGYVHPLLLHCTSYHFVYL